MALCDMPAALARPICDMCAALRAAFTSFPSIMAVVLVFVWWAM
jgi:5,10-methenyltetrahydromethanopterin hydrogenase